MKTETLIDKAKPSSKITTALQISIHSCTNLKEICHWKLICLSIDTLLLPVRGRLGWGGDIHRGWEDGGRRQWFPGCQPENSEKAGKTWNLHCPAALPGPCWHDVETILACISVHSFSPHRFDLESKIISEMRSQLSFQMHQAPSALSHLARDAKLKLFKRVQTLHQKWGKH